MTTTTRAHSWHCPGCPTVLQFDSVDELLDAITGHKMVTGHGTPEPEPPVTDLVVQSSDLVYAVVAVVIAFVWAVLLLVAI